MARKSPADKQAAMRKVTGAWESFAPRTVFYGYTLARFKAALQPSHDTRAEIEALQTRLRVAIRSRDAADAKSMRLVKNVVFGVVGDPDHTEDGALYSAMKYVRKSARLKRRRQKKSP